MPQHEHDQPCAGSRPAMSTHAEPASREGRQRRRMCGLETLAHHGCRTSRTRGSIAACATSPISVPSITAIASISRQPWTTRIIALAERRDQQRAEAGPREDELDCDGAAEDPADAQAENGDNGQQRMRAAHAGPGCARRDTPLACSRSTKSLAPDLDHRHACDARDERDAAKPMVSTGRTSACQVPRRTPETSRAARKTTGSSAAPARSSERWSRAE